MARRYFTEVLLRWLLSYGLFLAYQECINAVADSRDTQIDPSGKIACTIVSQAGHFSYLFFLLSLNESESESDVKDIDRAALSARVVRILAKVAVCVVGLLQVHACYSSFLTAWIFHTIYESMIGLLIGILIVTVAYEWSLIARYLECVLFAPF